MIAYFAVVNITQKNALNFPNRKCPQLWESMDNI